MIWSLISLLSYFVTVSENNTNPKTLQFIQMLMRSSKLRIRILVYVFCWLNYIVTQLYAPTHVRHKTSIIKYQVPIPKWARLSFFSTNPDLRRGRIRTQNVREMSRDVEIQM